jgi:hypothetical protein
MADPWIVQYALLIITVQGRPAVPMERCGVRWMSKIPLLYEVWPAFSLGESISWELMKAMKILKSAGLPFMTLSTDTPLKKEGKVLGMSTLLEQPSILLLPFGCSQNRLLWHGLAWSAPQWDFSMPGGPGKRELVSMQTSLKRRNSLQASHTY